MMIAIRYLIISIVLWNVSVIPARSQVSINKEKIMAIIYEQKLDSLSIRLECSIKENSYQWETKLVNNKKNKEITLLLDNKEIWGTSLLKGKNEDDYLKLYNILATYIKEKTLYIVYEKWGIIFLYSFQFTSPETFICNNRELTGHFVTPAYGKLTSNAIFKDIRSSIYLLVNVGQSFNTQNFYELYSIKDIHNISKVSFLESCSQIVATFGLSANAKSYLASVKDENQLSGNSLKYYDFIKQFKDKPYYFKKLSLDRNIRINELYELQTQGLSLYDNFNSTNLNTPKEEIIKEVISFCDIDFNVKYLDCLQDKFNSIIYLFYTDNEELNVKIIKYEINHCIWVVSDYNLEKIKTKVSY